MALDRGVWTEREDEVGTVHDDWEACVATSYAMGLLYGGAPMKAPYSKIERERLEKVKDEPQDLNTTDVMSKSVYGVRLRVLSTGSIAAAVARAGVGLCLTGVGSPGRQWQPGFTGMHEVFYVPATAAHGDLYDPLAPNFTPPERIASSRIVGWAKGAGANDAREVRKDEFVADRTVNATMFLDGSGKPVERTVTFAPGTHTGYNLAGQAEKLTIGTAGSSAPADARCQVIAANAPFAAAPDGWLRITGGAFADHPFVKEGPGVVAAPDPAPPSPDCDAALAERDAIWRASIIEALHPEE